jgi:hypothetical protein
MSFLFNPYSRAIKKYIYDLIPQNYTEEVDEISDRISSVVVNEKDTKRLMTLVGALYNAGYAKAIDDMKGKLEEQGIKLKINKHLSF